MGFTELNNIWLALDDKNMLKQVQALKDFSGEVLDASEKTDESIFDDIDKMLEGWAKSVSVTLIKFQTELAIN